MSEQLFVLQGGTLRARRRRAWLRVLGFVLLAVVIGLVALLAFMDSQAAGPTSIARGGRSRAGDKMQPPAPRPNYGIQLLPAAQRIHAKLKQPLQSGLLFDVQTGKVLWERNPDQQLPIASLTKMMTALVVVSRTKPTDKVLVTSAAADYSGSGVGVLPRGQRVPLLALLYGLLLPSGNDAAIALAQHVAGNRPNFIDLMNARARAMGMRCSHFNTVSGIIDLDNYSCAPDLAILAHAVVEQPLLAKIVASGSAALPFPIKGGKLFLYNNNPLLILHYPGTDGVKTGYTTAAGPCLVATARRGSKWLGVILLHSGDPSTQAQQLLNAGFAKRGI